MDESGLVYFEILTKPLDVAGIIGSEVEEKIPRCLIGEQDAGCGEQQEKADIPGLRRHDPAGSFVLPFPSATTRAM